MKSARLLGVAGAALPFVLSVIVLHCLLVLPNHPAAMTPGALGLFPLELPLVIAALLALGERKTLVRVLCGAFAVVLTVATVLKSADLVTYEALSRAFNPITDLPLVVAATRLLVSTLGTHLTIAAVLTAILSALLLAAFVYWASRTWAKVAVGRPWRLMAGGVAVCFALVCVADTGHVTGLWRLPVNPPGTAFTTRLACEELAESTRSLRELAAFRIVSQSDPYGDQRELFNKLDARNVVLIFLESYGRASFANPLYATAHLATLETAERELAAVGLAIRSGWLESPISGGQSWLAHGTLASGLRIADQSRYGAMLASPRQTLFHLAQAAGYRTIAVMPAITLPWPEGPRMGFETILTARNMGYRGQSFNWVTMPDQFTLATYPSRLDVDPRPDFVQVALISSHAPWIPIPPMIAWETIGDGKVFDQWAQSGESPAELWL